jgi:hypothetical protein
MRAHKHGIFSFTVRTERMRAEGSDEFVAEVTSLRKHDFTGAAMSIEVPNLPEQYGQTASAAEGNAIAQMKGWLSRVVPFTRTSDHRSP